MAAWRKTLLTRRRLFLVGGAAAGVGVLGLAWIGFASPKDLVFALLRRALPGVRLDRDSVGLCAEDALVQFNAQFRGDGGQRASSLLKLKAVRALSQVFGVGGVAELGPVQERAEEITRLALTQLLPHSNFFDVADPKVETIYYNRPDPNAACGNPFANITPPE